MSCYHSATQPRNWNPSCFYFIFFTSSVATLLDNRNGPLSMLGRAHITKLCKDTGKGVDTVLILIHKIWFKP